MVSDRWRGTGRVGVSSLLLFGRFVSPVCETRLTFPTWENVASYPARSAHWPLKSRGSIDDARTFLYPNVHLNVLTRWISLDRNVSYRGNHTGLRNSHRSIVCRREFYVAIFLFDASYANSRIQGRCFGLFACINVIAIRIFFFDGIRCSIVR